MNGGSRPEALRELKQAAEGLRVTFIDSALDSDDRYRLLRSCDAFVSLHRAEGFGLGMAEAMAYGMPVVATGWSGNMDFMNDRNSFPVRYELLPLDREDPPYEKGTIWALPDVGHAAEQMRLVAEDRVRASDVGTRARSEIEKYNSATAIGAQILARLEVIDALCRARARQGGGPRLPSASGYVGATNRPLAVGTRSLAFRALRGVWRTILRVTPIRFHPRLQRLSIRIRRLIPV